MSDIAAQAWDQGFEELRCDDCGSLVGFGSGDFNGCALFCPQCMEKRAKKP